MDPSWKWCFKWSTDVIVLQMYRFFLRHGIVGSEMQWNASREWRRCEHIHINYICVYINIDMAEKQCRWILCVYNISWWKKSTLQCLQSWSWLNSEDCSFCLTSWGFGKRMSCRIRDGEVGGTDHCWLGAACPPVTGIVARLCCYVFSNRTGGCCASWIQIRWGKCSWSMRSWKVCRWSHWL